MNKHIADNHRRVTGFYRFNQYYPFSATKVSFMGDCIRKIYFKHYHNKRYAIKNITA